MLSSDPKWQGEGKFMQAKRDDDYVSFYLKGWMHNRLMSNVGPFSFFRICLNFCMWASF